MSVALPVEQRRLRDDLARVLREGEQRLHHLRAEATGSPAHVSDRRSASSWNGPTSYTLIAALKSILMAVLKTVRRGSRHARVRTTRHRCSAPFDQPVTEHNVCKKSS